MISIKTFEVSTLSPESFFCLRKGTTAPAFFAIFAIFFESVETIILSKS